MSCDAKTFYREQIVLYTSKLRKAPRPMFLGRAIRMFEEELKKIEENEEKRK